MTNREIIEDNLSKTKEMTQEYIDNMSSFSSGRKIVPGDKLMFGMLETGDILNPAEMGVRMIKFHIEEYGTIYEDAYDGDRGATLPGLKYKSNQ